MPDAEPQPTAPPHDIAPAFRQAMRRLTSTVCIVSSRQEGRPVGMTMTAVTSVSMDPPSLLICAKRTSSLHGALHLGTRFCVNVLRVGHDEVAAAFGGGAPHSERFSIGRWAVDEPLPFLMDALSNLSCTVEATLNHGSHTLFIGGVQEIRDGGQGAPLIYGDGRYGP